MHATGGDPTPLTRSQAAAFERDGYLTVRQLAPPELVDSMRRVTRQHLTERRAPLELEAELGYPGAPSSTEAVGGDAIRRLRGAYGRHPVFRRWVHYPPLTACLRALLGDGPVLMPRAHHNCIMTKLPRFSSDSLWHQDLRYWRYARGELVTAWLALGREHAGNGGLQLIPGTHRQNLAAWRFDEARFLRLDLTENDALVAQRVSVELEAGDVLFFHSRLLHAATRNAGPDPKLAAVFTFRRHDDEPLPGSRSEAGGDVTILPG
ncbi:phytanoyl-CoA dioxygenase family protein [Ectothiorhodospiraceae bacterium WFHF3C12]|nr:phytanoyl-CoA dioxygenase family protein [Ectothiorhodospiraceae bacterium WFHF3C12]